MLCYDFQAACFLNGERNVWAGRELADPNPGFEGQVDVIEVDIGAAYEVGETESGLILRCKVHLAVARLDEDCCPILRDHAVPPVRGI